MRKKEDIFKRVQFFASDFAHDIIGDEKLNNYMKQLEDFISDYEDKQNLARTVFHAVVFHVISILAIEFCNLEVKLQLEEIDDEV